MPCNNSPAERIPGHECHGENCAVVSKASKETTRLVFAILGRKLDDPNDLQELRDQLNVIQRLTNTLGFDVTDPEAISAFQDRQQFLKRFKILIDRAILAIIGTSAVGLAYAAWEGIKVFFIKSP